MVTDLIVDVAVPKWPPLPPRRTKSSGGKPMPKRPEACNEALRQRGCDLIMAPPPTTLESSLAVEVFLVTTDKARAC
jgi:hypothetical protein